MIKVTNLTVKQIEEKLQSLKDEELLRNYLIKLENDNRKSVERLVQKYQKKIEADRKEKERVRNLWNFEALLLQKNYKYIVGIDEAGRGPLAGPVVAAAVILPSYCFIEGLNDSKKLTPVKRELMAIKIKEKAIACSVGIVDNLTIDKMNILQATRYAMLLAFKSLKTKPQYALIDGEKNPLIKIPQWGIVNGDGRSASIAAASIIAKVYRDNLMKVYDQLYPGYYFSTHKGYGTKEHLQILNNKGPSPIHRFTFSPVNSMK